jgi:hypothetical protein
MSVNDFQLQQNPIPSQGTIRMNVAASATLAYPGDMVGSQTKATTVTAILATGSPIVGTDFVHGIAMSTSTNTAAAAGVVDFMPVTPGQVWLVNPTTAADYNTQAKYDALVGKAIVMALSAGGVWTAGSTNSAAYGLVVMPLDIIKTPGKVAVRFKDTVSFYQAASA